MSVVELAVGLVGPIVILYLGVRVTRITHSPGVVLLGSKCPPSSMPFPEASVENIGVPK